MSTPRDRKWLSLRGLAGGLALFVSEAIIVIALAIIALLVSAVLIAIL